MPNLSVVSTNDGVTEITQALTDIASLDITKFKIGDSSGYTPTVDQLDIQGNLVFDQTTVGTSIDKILVGTNSAELTIVISGAALTGSLGEFMFMNSSDKIMAIGVFDTPITKSAGFTVKLKLLIHISNTGGVTLTLSSTVHNSLNVVETRALLPNFTTASSNAYIVKDEDDAFELAYKNVEDDVWEKISQVKGATVSDSEIVLSNSDRTIKTSTKSISSDGDFVTDAADKVPTKSAVEARIVALMDGVPDELNTLNKLATLANLNASAIIATTNAAVLKVNNLSDLPDKAVSRDNLGVDAASVLIGSVVAFAFSTPPTGWLECNGASLSRTTYAGLFAKIGTLYGNVDGNTFNLPDTRGQIVRGWSHGSGEDPDAASRSDSGGGTTGDNVGTRQGHAFQNWSATFTVPIRTGETYIAGAISESGQGRKNATTFDSSGLDYTINPSLTAQTSTETRPKNIAFMYCIKY